MSEAAVLRLAKIRESYIQDEQGRDLAAEKAVKGFIEAAEKARLKVETKEIVHRIQLGNASQVSVRLSAEAGQVLLGDKVEAIEGLEYNPITKEFVGPDGEDAVDYLARVVGTALEDKVELARRKSQPAVDQDYEEALGDAQQWELGRVAEVVTSGGGRRPGF